MKFRPSGSLTRKVPASRCKGRPRMTRFGSFVGTIRFAGEHGYTKVNTGRARGSSHVARQWKCKSLRGAGGSVCRPDREEPRESVILAARSKQGRSFEAFSGRSPEEPASTFFFASAYERRGRMLIHRFTIVDGPERTFTNEDGLSAATVSPPPSFTGSATFQRNPDRSTSWTGTLRVSLLGAPNLVLAGSAFRTSLVRPAPERASSDLHRVSFPVQRLMN